MQILGIKRQKGKKYQKAYEIKSKGVDVIFTFSFKEGLGDLVWNPDIPHAVKYLDIKIEKGLKKGF